MFFRKKAGKGGTYLQLVESYREEGRVRQRVLLTLGRLEEMQASGRLDALLASGSRLSQEVMVLSARKEGPLADAGTRRIGAPMVFERLWRETGCAGALERQADGRKFGFSLERAVFATVLHRLVASGSDRACEQWLPHYRVEGAGSLALQHFYRAMGFLGEPLPESGQDHEAKEEEQGFSPRCVKDLIEEDLFHRRRSLFTRLDLMFFDTTSVYFEGEGGESIGQRGHSKDHRPDLKQMVAGAVLDGEGHPVCCELWPGNSTDVKALVPVAQRLRERFGVEASCLVADRGMISQKTLAWLEAPEHPWSYILGARMRKQREVSEEVLSRAGRYRVVHEERLRAKDPSPLKVKEVWVENRRYVVCLNEEQARKDAHDRQAILSALDQALRRGDKSLVGNKGYRRYLKASGPRFEIDLAKAEAEARTDGKWVLRTNTDLKAEEVALKYKQLWRVEDLFRSVKSVLATRPIYHKRDETIRGHVFCSFLALLLRKELQDRMARAGVEAEWADVIRDLDEVQEVQLEQEGKRFLLRTAAAGCAGKVFQAAGVALPPTLRAVRS
ncbi:MAG: transposase [Deltaproteobacteria bacterium 21-66-5]|nr:MAG: transposase [Deltaproteobacteria bacterium 21-66-5]